jgi:predicted phosphodiesterase
MNKKFKNSGNGHGNFLKGIHNNKKRTQSDDIEFNYSQSNNWILTRRVFLKSSLLVAAASFLNPFKSVAGINNPEAHEAQSILRFGIVTDSHYADIDTAGSRFYRESLSKMKECVDLMNQKEVDFLIHLGDFKNGAPDLNLENLKLIESEYARFKGPRYHVIGNHDMDSISRADFQSVVENTGIDPDHTWYSFDRHSVHFVVLDANFTSEEVAYNRGNFHWTDANIPASQLEWLENDITSTDKPVVIFIHQLLDSDEGSHYVNNAAEVRHILESSRNVLVVFQGHQHDGQYSIINNIHYYTLKAMVEGSGKENNAYAIVEIFDNFSVTISGYRKAVNKELLTAE